MVTLQNVVASLARSLWTPRYSVVLPNGFIGNIIVYGVRFEGGVVSGSFLREALSSTTGSAAPPQNHRLPGQIRLNHQYLLRPKMPQRWRRLHPLLGGLAHGRCQPTHRLFYDTTSPDIGRKFHHSFARPGGVRHGAKSCYLQLRVNRHNLTTSHLF
jgi:hypothetical protein